MVAALHALTRIGCTAHMLNTVMHTTLEKPGEDDLFDEEVSALIKSAKANFQSHRKKTLKASVDTLEFPPHSVRVHLQPI